MLAWRKEIPPGSCVWLVTRVRAGLAPRRCPPTCLPQHLVLCRFNTNTNMFHACPKRVYEGFPNVCNTGFLSSIMHGTTFACDDASSGRHAFSLSFLLPPTHVRRPETLAPN